MIFYESLPANWTSQAIPSKEDFLEIMQAKHLFAQHGTTSDEDKVWQKANFKLCPWGIAYSIYGKKDLVRAAKILYVGALLGWTELVDQLKRTSKNLRIAEKDRDALKQFWADNKDIIATNHNDAVKEFEVWVKQPPTPIVTRRARRTKVTEAKKKKNPYSSISFTTGNIKYNIDQFNKRMGTYGLGTDNNNPSTAEAQKAVQKICDDVGTIAAPSPDGGSSISMGAEGSTGVAEALTEAKRYVRRYYIRPQNIFCSNKADIIRNLIEIDKSNGNCSVYTLNNLGDEKDVTKLTNKDIIYYYDDGILYDKNHVKVMDYDLYIKHEENRDQIDVDSVSDNTFKDVYDDRLTDQTMEEGMDLQEASSMSPLDKMRAFNNGTRRENVKACGDQKLHDYLIISLAHNLQNAARQIEAELINRGLQTVVDKVRLSYIDSNLPGTAYFADEYAKVLSDFSGDGGRIAQYCTDNKLSIPSALALLTMAICHQDSVQINAIKDYLLVISMFTPDNLKTIVKKCVSRPATQERIAAAFDKLNNIVETVEVQEAKIPTCCICGDQLDSYGNNPFPVKEDGVCCDACNIKFVIPARIEMMQERED